MALSTDTAVYPVTSRRRGRRHDEHHANPETSPSPPNLTSHRLHSTQRPRSLPTTTLDRPCCASVGPHLALANAALTNAHPLRHISLRYHAHTERNDLFNPFPHPLPRIHAATFNNLLNRLGQCPFNACRRRINPLNPLSRQCL